VKALTSVVLLSAIFLSGCNGSGGMASPSIAARTPKPSPTPNLALEALKRATLENPSFMKSEVFPYVSVDFDETSPTRVWVAGFLQSESQFATLQINCPYNLINNIWVFESYAWISLNGEDQGAVPCASSIPAR
jgi:hypothetical protein